MTGSIMSDVAKQLYLFFWHFWSEIVASNDDLNTVLLLLLTRQLLLLLLYADRSEQEARGWAAEAETRLGGGSSTERGTDRQSTQETTGCCQRTIRTSRPAAEG